MSKIKCTNWHGSEPLEFDVGQSKEAKNRSLWEREQGIDSKSLAENAVGRDQKALRESQVLRALGFEVDDLKRRERKSPGSLTVADVVLLERRIETLKSNVAGRENNIAESVSLSEGQVLPGENGKKSYKAWWPLLKEGPGNGVAKNYYSRKALESVVPLIKSRNKMFFSHVEGDVKPSERSVKDWAASILETKIENGVLYGLVQALDPWLKERMYDCPQDLAASIEARGKANGTINHAGQPWNLIESVSWLNGFQIVDYPGNAPMGIGLIEVQRLQDTYKDWTDGKIKDDVFLREIEKLSCFG